MIFFCRNGEYVEDSPYFQKVRWDIALILRPDFYNSLDLISIHFNKPVGSILSSDDLADTMCGMGYENWSIEDSTGVFILKYQRINRLKKPVFDLHSTIY